jgi:hypothetical protein
LIIQYFKLFRFELGRGLFFVVVFLLQADQAQVKPSRIVDFDTVEVNNPVKKLLEL